ncbi:hypothetical protein OROGR_006291 [Orobanche gracilis]
MERELWGGASSGWGHGGNGQKPPDDNATRQSFRDKLLGTNSATPPKQRVNFWKEKKMTLEFVQGNEMLPRIRVDKGLTEAMCAPWKEALVVSLLGKKLGFRTMEAKLADAWNLAGDFDLLDVDNGFYMVREFISPKAKVSRTLAWIRIPGLNPAFYDESYLMYIAEVIGKPVRVDINTLRGERRKFARIYVELDLTKPVYGRVMIDDDWFKIEYEGLYVICTRCGCYGHRSRECTKPETSKLGPALAKNDPGKVETAPADATQPKEPLETLAVSKPMIIGESNGSTNLGAKHGPTVTENIKEINEDVIVVKDDRPEIEVFGDWMTVNRKKKQ